VSICSSCRLFVPHKLISINYFPSLFNNKVNIPLSSTLQTLKDEISKNPNVSNAEQRIFFLGRELKSNHKSLSSLGIGNLGIFVLHLHVKKTSAISATVTSGAASSTLKGKNDKKKSSDKPIKSTDDDVIELIDSSPRSSRQQSTQSQPSGTRRKRGALNSAASQSNASATVETIELLDDGESQGQTTSTTSRKVKAKKSGGPIATIDLLDG
jgi:hypothetical protein